MTQEIIEVSFSIGEQVMVKMDNEMLVKGTVVGVKPGIAYRIQFDTGEERDVPFSDVQPVKAIGPRAKSKKSSKKQAPRKTPSVKRQSTKKAPSSKRPSKKKAIKTPKKSSKSSKKSAKTSTKSFKRSKKSAKRSKKSSKSSKKSSKSSGGKTASTKKSEYVFHNATCIISLTLPATRD